MGLPKNLENLKRKSKFFFLVSNFLWAGPLLFSLTSCNVLDNQISASDPSHLADQWKAHNEWWESIEDGDFALYVRQPDKSIQYFDQAIKQANSFGQADPRRAKSYVSLGRAYLEKSDFQKAHEALSKGLELKEKLHGKDSNELSGTLTDLALVEFNLHKLKEAKALSDRTIELRKVAKDSSGSSELKYVRGLILSQSKDAKNEVISESFESAIKDFSTEFESKKLLLDTSRLKNYANCLHSYSDWLTAQKQTAKVDVIKKKLESVERYLNEFQTKS